MRIAGVLLATALLPAGAGPDYAKLLEKAKLTLSEAVEKGAKEVPGGSVVSAYMEENEGKPRYFLYVAKERKTVEVSLDLTDGSVLEKETLPDDDSKILGAVKIPLGKAIEIALKKVPGKAVYADFDVDDQGPPEAQIDVFARGKVTKVYVHAVTGEVIRTDPP
jgi:uncharacterized membrane protein YkoI